MSKNYSQTGIGDSVEFSKGGSRVRENTGVLEVRDNADTAFTQCRGADPVIDDDLATKRYVDSTSSGEVNTATNIGGGEGVFATKVLEELEFKSLTSTGSVSITSTPTEINIDSTGEANTATNIGGGEGVFATKVLEELEFKSITGSGAVTVTATADEIDIHVPVTPPAAVTRVLFSRRGNTGNNTFLDVDDFPTRLPFFTQGASGWPFSPLAPATVTRLLFRTRNDTNVPATFEVLRCQGNGFAGTAVSLGTVVVPNGVFEFDAAPGWVIPAGSWTLVARRTAGGGGGANAWVDPTVILEVS